MANFENYIEKNKLGESNDVWLIKYNFLGRYEKVSLVFGFWNDMEFCQEVAAMYNQKYRDANLSCMIASQRK